MDTLSPPKQHRELHFVASFEKPPSVLHLNFAVVIICLGAQADFLEDDDVATLGVLLPFLALVLELAVVHYTADGGSLSRRHLDKIKPRLPGQPMCLGDWNDAELLLVLVYHPDR